MSPDRSETEPVDEASTAIVFSGGGARGAYEAGVLSGMCKYILDDLDHPPNINVLVGTSSGAVNAYYLAGCLDRFSEGVQEMVELWKSLQLEENLVPSTTGSISMIRWLMGGSNENRISILDPSNIRNLIREEFPWERIRPAMNQGLLHSLCITATELATGQNVLFTDTVMEEMPPLPAGRDIRWTRTQILPEHVFSSSSIPLFFPAHRIDGTLYYDGGLRMDVPITPALSLGAKKIFVIGVKTPQPEVPEEALDEPETTEEETSREAYPGAPEIIGKILNALLLDPVERERKRMFALKEMIENGKQAYGTEFGERVAELLTPYMGGNLNNTSFYFHRPERDLGVLSKDYVPEIGERIGGIWGRIFKRFASSSATGNWDLASYMMFDEDYTTKLIELGEEDVHAHKEEITAFFRNDLSDQNNNSG